MWIPKPCNGYQSDRSCRVRGDRSHERTKASWSLRFSESACSPAGPAMARTRALNRHRPAADVIPKQLELFGRVRVDPYYWLNDRTNPKVKAYLEAENAYTDAIMAHTKALQQSLYDEIVGRIKQADATAPVFDNGYYYYTRFETGKQYPILVRKKGSLEAAEEVLLDENALAAGQGYFSLGGVASQPGQPQARIRGRYRRPPLLHDPDQGPRADKVLDDTIADVTSNLAWANDSQTLFYTRQDPKTLRSSRIYRHTLGAGHGRSARSTKRQTTRSRAGSSGPGPIAT